MKRRKRLVSLVLGLQWGDEGKGKIVDLLAKYFKIVIRYGGGANAGHTVEFDGKKFIGHLLATGVFSKAFCILGKGVRIELVQLLSEMLEAEKIKGSTIRIGIDPSAFLMLPWHKLIEQYVEGIKSLAKQGTSPTFRGMAPNAATNALRLNVPFSMLMVDRGDPHERVVAHQRLYKRLKVFHRVFNPWFEKLRKQGVQIPRPRTVFRQLLKAFKELEPHIMPYSDIDLKNALERGEKVLLEGAQGYRLDASVGFPYCTSSPCTSAGAFHDAGLPFTSADRLIGVAKVVQTRVGNGPLVGELGTAKETARERKIPVEKRAKFLRNRLRKINHGKTTPRLVGQYFRVIAKEYGATTGRPRRISWLDLVALRHAVWVNGITELVILKLDCLTGLKKLKLITGYRWNHYRADKRYAFGLDEMPQSAEEWERVAPEYIVLKGWSRDVSRIRSYQKLPKNARAYIELIQKFVGCRITMIGNGPARNQLILKK